MKNCVYIISLSLFLSGCLLGPNYRSPENVIDDAWHAECPAICPEEEPPPVGWWELLDDPYLNFLIEAAAHYNNDVLKAEVNIAQARAVRVMTASSLYPQVAADLSYVRTYFSKNGPVFSITNGQTNAISGLPFQVQIPQIQNLYNALIDVSWEIDVFGKTRRAVEAADYQIGAAIANRNDVLISILAEVARNYVELRSAQKRGQLIEENLTLLEKISTISSHRLKAGSYQPPRS